MLITSLCTVHNRILHAHTFAHFYKNLLVQIILPLNIYIHSRQLEPSKSFSSDLKAENQLNKC